MSEASERLSEMNDLLENENLEVEACEHDVEDLVAPKVLRTRKAIKLSANLIPSGSTIDSKALETLLKRLKAPYRFEIAETSQCSRINRYPRANRRIVYPRISNPLLPENAGALAGIMSSPLDIFYEIAANLQPIDLLNLSRSSHGLRNNLMTKRSSIVWQKARQNVPLLPECPKDLNEPEYASLLFDSYCQICGGGGTKRVYFFLRLRACRACYDLNVGVGKRVLAGLKLQLSLDEEVFLLLPAETDSKLKPSSKNFFIPDLINVINIYNSFTSDVVGRADFVKKMQQRTAEIRDHGRNVMDWFHEKKMEEKKEGSGGKMMNRINGIHARLRQIGYMDVDLENIDDEYTDAWSKCLEQKYDLTENVWDRIQPTLVNIIDARREKRCEERRKELVARYSKYLNRLSSRDNDQAFIPSAEEFLLLEPVRAITMQSETINESKWNTLSKRIPELFDEHKLHLLRNAEKNLRELYEVLLQEQLLSRSFVKRSGLIELASSLFLCGASEREECLTGVYDLSGVLIHTSRCSSGAKKYINCSASVIRTACLLLRSFGLSLNTTMECITEAGCTFQCPCCEPIFKKSMTWFEMITHFLQEERWSKKAKALLENLEDSDSTLDIEIIDDHSVHQIELSRRLMVHLGRRDCDSHTDVSSSTSEQTFTCALCFQLDPLLTKPFAKKEEVDAHIRSKHGRNPQETDMRRDGFISKWTKSLFGSVSKSSS